MEKLRSYLKSLPHWRHNAFAKRCGTTMGHLRNILYGQANCAEKLAINLEREARKTGGNVFVEELRPDVDWAYLRGTRKRGIVPTPLKKKFKRGSQTRKSLKAKGKKRR
jgi:DNA-binding transcriptional regulator YdaS (Cro superfamily)